MTKTCIVLYIYDLLKSNGSFNLSDIENKFSCSYRTAARYIHDLKEYLKIFQLNLDIEFDAKHRSYKLIKK